MQFFVDYVAFLRENATPEKDRERPEARACTDIMCAADHVDDATAKRWAVVISDTPLTEAEAQRYIASVLENLE